MLHDDRDGGPTAQVELLVLLESRLRARPDDISSQQLVPQLGQHGTIHFVLLLTEQPADHQGTVAVVVEIGDRRDIAPVDADQLTGPIERYRRDLAGAGVLHMLTNQLGLGIHPAVPLAGTAQPLPADQPSQTIQRHATDKERKYACGVPSPSGGL